MARTVRLTQEGHDRLTVTLAQEYVRLEEATKILQELTGSSDDYDDSGLEDAKQEKARIENRIDDLEDQLDRAEIISDKDAAGRIDLGSVVTLKEQDAAKEMRVQVVAPVEAGVLEGEVPRVSDESPLGKALIGHAAGDTVTVTLGDRTKRYEVVSIA
ncbi:MAG: GreA/GreB family elongation factor [Trueperaceae bacterium]|nr:GreA/GreB family elongation factor [Trueperaceae bacterium]